MRDDDSQTHEQAQRKCSKLSSRTKEDNVSDLVETVSVNFLSYIHHESLRSGGD